METTPSTDSVQRYYDGHAQQVQERVGINRRHRSILRRMVRAGLRRDHNVLEIGCGIGQITGLLAERVKAGSVLGVDISPKAIELASQRLKGCSNVKLAVNDMSGFRTEERFDRILLPDVLEHIPEADHDRLFATIAGCLAPMGRVCIHIPDPASIEWARRERPDLLQIIDQPLAILPMAERFARVGLVLKRYETYGLWTREPDYDWIEFGRPAEPRQTRLGYIRQVCRELASRVGL